MTNQAKFDDEGYPIKAMRKGNNIKDLTSSNVVLVKPSQDCQAKEKVEKWLDKWWEDKTICDFDTDVAWEMVKIALQEQAKEIKARLEQEANLTINKIYSTKKEKSKKELQYRIAISNWNKFWEKYGVKEEKDEYIQKK